MRTSYSALDTFQTCPQKYKFSEIDRIKAPKSPEAVFGTLLHQVLQFIHKSEPRFPTLEEALKFFRDNWPSVEKAHWRDEFEEQSNFASGVKMISDYYESNKPLDNKHTIDLESHFEAFIEDSDSKESHVIAGKIDRLAKNPDGSYEIIDYKTSKRMPSQEEVDNNLQLSIYHLALIKKWPHLQSGNIKLTLHFLRHNERLSTKRNEEQLAQTKSQILKIIGEIEKSSFPPTPSVLCDWCGYQKICPMWKHKFKEEQNELFDVNIKAILREFFEIKERGQKDGKRIDELKKIINEYCDKEDIEQVFGDNGSVMRQHQQRFEYDLEKVRAILEPLGKWDKILKIDSAALSKTTKELPKEIREKIAETKKVSSEFTVLSVKKSKPGG